MKAPLPDRVQMTTLYLDIAGLGNHDGNCKPILNCGGNKHCRY